MASNDSACCAKGPGYATPEDAIHGPRETLLYVPAIVPEQDRPDYLCTVDADPTSSSYSQVIHRLPMPNVGDELHHSGWNACSSCHGDSGRARKYLVLPCVGSGRVYGINCASPNERAPKLEKVVEAAEIHGKTGLGSLHTSHCLPSGDLMISCMGDPDGFAKGGFVLLDQDFKVKGRWSDETTEYGYDFWYQPKHNVMISTEWGAPCAFKKGFNPAEVPTSYGDTIHFWDWQERKLVQSIKLGSAGLIPLETRFLHSPSSLHGYVGAALSSNIIHFTKGADGKWKHKVAVSQEWTKVEGWVLPELPPLITDILISMDDRFLYFSNWLRGDLVQLDISDPENPKVASRIWLGGVIRKGSPVKVISGLPDGLEAPEVPTVQGKTLQGGPQMIQLSLDGKRLYVTNSLFTAWDKQFYGTMAQRGSYMLQVDVDTQKGGMTLNDKFFVDFGAEPDGPVLAHEIRYPGGDCSSDIFA